MQKKDNAKRPCARKLHVCMGPLMEPPLTSGVLKMAHAYAHIHMHTYVYRETESEREKQKVHTHLSINVYIYIYTHTIHYMDR